MNKRASHTPLLTACGLHADTPGSITSPKFVDRSPLQACTLNTLLGTHFQQGGVGVHLSCCMHAQPHEPMSAQHTRAPSNCRTNKVLL
jgi:hypothetical protein